MVSASVYVLKVPTNRREILLTAEKGYYGRSTVTEPVQSFNHSRRAPLAVLASFSDGQLTHIAAARKGASAGTGLVRLNMHAVEKLTKPIAFDELLKSVPAKVKLNLNRVLDSGGVLPPKT